MQQMLLIVVKVLKKKLGIEAIEGNWRKVSYFKIPSTLIIPEGVVRIGECSFWNCFELKKVVIPKSVEYIKGYSFTGCFGTTVVLKKPKSEFKEIILNAFWGCKHVKEEVGN